MQLYHISSSLKFTVDRASALPPKSMSLMSLCHSLDMMFASSPSVLFCCNGPSFIPQHHSIEKCQEVWHACRPSQRNILLTSYIAIQSIFIFSPVHLQRLKHSFHNAKGFANFCQYLSLFLSLNASKDLKFLIFLPAKVR